MGWLYPAIRGYMKWDDVGLALGFLGFVFFFVVGLFGALFYAIVNTSWGNDKLHKKQERQLRRQLGQVEELERTFRKK